MTEDDIEWQAKPSVGIPSYYIYSAAGFASVAYHVNNGDIDETTGQAYASATYTLTTDIDLSGLIWTPIGTTDNPFTGVFFSTDTRGIPRII